MGLFDRHIGRDGKGTQIPRPGPGPGPGPGYAERKFHSPFMRISSVKLADTVAAQRFPPPAMGARRY